MKTPKVYVRDSGLVHAILGIRDHEELLGHPVVGSSWEGMLIENIHEALPSTARTSFYRTSHGVEVDLVIEFNAQQRWAVEIKRSISDPSPSKGFFTACDDLKVTRRIVLYPGTESYRHDAQTEMMPLSRLIGELRQGVS